MIDWNKYFEHIFVISRCKNFERRKNLDKELERIGITNYQYWYMPDYDFKNSLIFKFGYKNMPISRQRCNFAHYSLWKTCYELNYNYILIIEDDAKFIDDLQKINEALENYKKQEYNIYMLDYALNEIDKNSSEYLINYLLGTCYVVNTKGLEYLIRCHEKYNIQIDHYFLKFNKKYIEINSHYFYFDISIPLYFDEKDISTNLEVSPIKICKQLNYYDKLE